MVTNNSRKTTPSAKTKRQARLLEIVRTQPVTTQTELAELLIKAGTNCTQVSVSRDIRELGLVKRDGRYVMPDSPADAPDLDDLAGTVGGFIQSAEIVGQNLVVVRTLPGTAHSVALLLDAVDWPGLAGSVAGDDTIFVAVHSSKAGGKVVRKLRKLM
ncbi:MAG: arginine repressor [Deltaproteobacteria bacterium]|nr:arginine repressor [Deltaproteobacteria bacterium]